MKIWQRMAALLKDDRGQSTTEYILILSVVVMLAMKFKGIFSSALIKAAQNVGNNIDTFSNETQ
jgi:Flp pilus assembly pilin Flp